MKDIFLIASIDSVACICASLIPHDNLMVSCKHVCHLTFSFISELCTYQDSRHFITSRNYHYRLLPKHHELRLPSPTARNVPGGWIFYADPVCSCTRLCACRL